ncbi:hypothetical protein DPMN_182884 [Dreissena polymorpha]|uniref:Uncharacterized protein n=1 Tax=Dreissena polymorpha TaxID=45954 RepID=A0A9D4DFP5_DREPO|nr:hypothetical protein DPMN_182884 [Dreissena polymorpha]
MTHTSFYKRNHESHVCNDTLLLRCRNRLDNMERNLNCNKQQAEKNPFSTTNVTRTIQASNSTSINT